MPPLIDIQSLLGIVGQDQQRQEADRRQGLAGAELGLRERSLNMQGEQNQAEMAERQQARELHTKLSLAQLLGGEKAAKATQEYQTKVLAQQEYQNAQKQAMEEKQFGLNKEKFDWTKEFGLKSLSAGQEQNQAENLIKMMGIQQKGQAQAGSSPMSYPGMAANLALTRKFGAGYRTNPDVVEQIGPWLDSEEGTSAVEKAAIEVSHASPRSVTTGGGIKNYNPKTGEYEDTGLGKPVSGADIEELSNMRTTYERLSDVEKNAARMKDKFGPIEGRWNNLKVQFIKDGATQRVVNELKSMITVAYSLSGKQISYREMELLQAAMLPRLEQPYENFQATLNFARDWMSKTHNNRLDYLRKSGYQTDISPLGTTGGGVQGTTGGGGFTKGKDGIWRVE